MCLQLNAVRSQSAATNQRLMAVAAELSMRQAQALALEQEVLERQQQVRTTRHTGFSKGVLKRWARGHERAAAAEGAEVGGNPGKPDPGISKTCCVLFALQMRSRTK